MNHNWFHHNIPDSSSDDEIEEQLIIQQIHSNNQMYAEFLRQQNVEPTRGGSVMGHQTIHRDREGAAANLFNDYFSENPTYSEEQFHRRFRMSRNLFLRIADAVKNHDGYFMQRRDASGKLGLSTFQKLTAVFRILAYGVAADATDEYIKIGESTAIECVKRFCTAVRAIFGEKYLRSPNATDVARLLYIGEQRGFPGMLGSLDCMHWKWKNCPTAWAARYSGRGGKPTIILEAVADYDLWIWHAYFGMPGSNNDINVLETSPLFADLAGGRAPPANYVIWGKEFNMGYYLADGIYPKWATIVQTIRQPEGRKWQYFAQRQEACRKDVERAFGVLRGKFAIVANPARLWRKNDLQDIIYTCIIMHNMIIEDERDLSAPIVEAMDVPSPDEDIVFEPTAPTLHQKFLARLKKIRDNTDHYILRDAIIEHLWDEYSNS